MVVMTIGMMMILVQNHDNYGGMGVRGHGGCSNLAERDVFGIGIRVLIFW